MAVSTVSPIRAAFTVGTEMLVHFYETLRHHIPQGRLQLLDQLFKKFPDFVEPEISIRVSQKPVVEPNPESA